MVLLAYFCQIVVANPTNSVDLMTYKPETVIDGSRDSETPRASHTREGTRQGVELYAGAQQPSGKQIDETD